MTRRLEISEPTRKTDRGVDEIRAPHFVTETAYPVSNAYNLKPKYGPRVTLKKYAKIKKKLFCTDHQWDTGFQYVQHPKPNHGSSRTRLRLRVPHFVTEIGYPISNAYSTEMTRKRRVLRTYFRICFRSRILRARVACLVPVSLPI